MTLNNDFAILVVFSTGAGQCWYIYAATEGRQCGLVDKALSSAGMARLIQAHHKLSKSFQL